MSSYPHTQLLIGGTWRAGAGGRTLPVRDPATGGEIGRVDVAETADLDAALAAADAGFAAWSAVPVTERSRILRAAADLIRARTDAIAEVMTLEQGKRLTEARIETLTAGEVIEWCAEEARRAYGRVVPSRAPGVEQIVTKEPIGPVAAFTPWNFPINQAVRKIAAALAAGCSIILKGPEETPASVAALVQAFQDAGVPAGVIALVYGEPAHISDYLIPHPVIRKVSFTGSTAVGKHLAALAGAHMKRITLELGGHAPVIVTADADLDTAVKLLAVQKFWNAGQTCISPTRFLVEDAVHDAFVDKFTAAAGALKVGPGLAKDTRMGPLANPRRVEAMEALVADAVAKGASLRTGGKRIANAGFFFEPTVLADVPLDARIMNEEPFGPIASFRRFSGLDEAIGEANRLRYGLAAYAFTGSARTSARLARSIRSGMVAVNSISLALPEVPFGGIGDSGYGSEGGSEAIEAYLDTKFVSLGTR